MGAGEEDQEKSADTIPANFLKLIYCENLFCVSYNAEMASDGFQTIAELFQMTADSSQIIADDSQMISGNIQNKKYNTMITGSNLLAEYSRFSQNILPKELQQEEFDSLAEDFDLMNEDEDISKYVDTFIELLNDVPEKQTSKPQSTFIRQDVTAEVLKKAEEREAGVKPKSASKTTKSGNRTTAKSKLVKSPKPKPDNEVTELPLAVVFIKAYCGRAGKVKTKTQVYTFIKRLQKAIAEKKIRKTSEKAPVLKNIHWRQSRHRHIKIILLINNCLCCIFVDRFYSNADYSYSFYHSRNHQFGARCYWCIFAVTAHYAVSVVDGVSVFQGFAAMLRLAVASTACGQIYS